MHDDLNSIRKAGNSVSMNPYDPYYDLLKSRMLSQRDLEIRHLLKAARQDPSRRKETFAPTIRHFGTLLVRFGTRLEKVAIG